MNRQILNVVFNSAEGSEKEATVAYFVGSSAQSLVKATAASLALTDDEARRLVLTDEATGRPLAAAGEIPARAFGTLADKASERSRASFPLDLQQFVTLDLPEDQNFQGQYLKFERVLSHLANERTWLAWLRAALTLLSSGFVLWQLYAKVCAPASVVRTSQHRPACDTPPSLARAHWSA